MTVRPVLRYPNPVLKRVAPQIDPEGDRAKKIASDLVETMRSFKGCVGLSAPQIDADARIIAVDVSQHPKATESHGLLKLVNPKVALAEGSEMGREGCLSIPDLTANVSRAERVVIHAHEPGGAEKVVEAEGFEARCLQHEIDHLDGILFLDRVASVKTDVFRRKRY